MRSKMLNEQKKMKEKRLSVYENIGFCDVFDENMNCFRSLYEHARNFPNLYRVPFTPCFCCLCFEAI